VVYRQEGTVYLTTIRSRRGAGQARSHHATQAGRTVVSCGRTARFNHARWCGSWPAVNLRRVEVLGMITECRPRRTGVFLHRPGSRPVVADSSWISAVGRVCTRRNGRVHRDDADLVLRHREPEVCSVVLHREIVDPTRSAGAHEGEIKSGARDDGCSRIRFPNPKEPKNVDQARRRLPPNRST